MNQNDQVIFQKTPFNPLGYQAPQIDPNKFFEKKSYQDLYEDLNPNNSNQEGYDIFSQKKPAPSFQSYLSFMEQEQEQEVSTNASIRPSHKSECYTQNTQQNFHLFDTPWQTPEKSDSFGSSSASKMSESSNQSSSCQSSQSPQNSYQNNNIQRVDFSCVDNAGVGGLHLSAPKRKNKSPNTDNNNSCSKRKVYLEGYIQEMMDQPFTADGEMSQKLLVFEVQSSQ